MNRLQRLLAGAALVGVVAVPGSKANAQRVDSPVVIAANPLVGISASILAFGDSLVARARAQIGTRYKMGGTAPERGFDCSGLVKFVAKAFDITLPRTARQQATMGTAVPKDLAAMKPGDLLTFGKGKTISHIGIYVGEGRFVHASTTSHKVIETSLIGTRSPLIKQWKGVRRVAEGVSVKLRDSLMTLAMADTGR
ncbi:MAG: C40 family peptidase [Gemmatimonas sp.]